MILMKILPMRLISVIGLLEDEDVDEDLAMTRRQEVKFCHFLRQLT